MKLLFSKLFLLNWILFVSYSYGLSESNNPQIMNKDSLKFYQKKLDSVVKIKNPKEIDRLICNIKDLIGSEPWKNNSLGILYMLKKDRKSKELSELHLKRALEQGVESSEQNLAELYFSEKKYKLSLHYLQKIKAQNHRFPTLKYLNWARLYGQNLYIGAPAISNKKQALNIFEKIKNFDQSGTSYYFLGYDHFKNGHVNKGVQELLVASKNDNVSALLFLADMYYSGINIEKDSIKAKEFYLKAADLNSSRAYYNLAIICQSEKNIVCMKNYLQRAAELGSESAVQLFKRLKSTK